MTVKNAVLRFSRRKSQLRDEIMTHSAENARDPRRSSIGSSIFDGNYTLTCYSPGLIWKRGPKRNPRAVARKNLFTAAECLNRPSLKIFTATGREIELLKHLGVSHLCWRYDSEEYIRRDLRTMRGIVIIYKLASIVANFRSLTRVCP